MELHELTQLSTQDRLQAMELLWQSFTEQQSGDLIPPWHQQVLDDRMARMQRELKKQRHGSLLKTACVMRFTTYFKAMWSLSLQC